MIKQKYFIIIILAFAVLLAFHFFGRHRLYSSTPRFLLTKLDELMDDNKLMDSIGGSTYFECNFNENDFKLKDTVRYSIKIIGNERVLIYTAVHLRKKPDGKNWERIAENLTIE